MPGSGKPHHSTLMPASLMIGVPTPANAALTHIVKRVEKGELQPDKRHILELRLN